MGQLLSTTSWTKDSRSDDSIVVTPMHSKVVGRTYFGCCCSPKRMYKVFKYAVEEWVFLALLGLIMATFSLVMDIMISKLQEGHMAFYRHFKSDPIWIISFFVWTLYVVVLICASALCAHYIAPQAIGSGIPEMKTVLRGVILKEYLSVRTLISKIIGLTLSLGSGLPIGKEGPFVHIASVVANQLNRFLTRSTGVFQNESRANELLAAGCAVGVACTFTAPVGGVLFSIEVTAAYFAIRNYWRGFFAATCSATLFSVLRGIRKGAGSNSSAWTDILEMSMEAHYQTNFTITDTYASSELMAFALMGLICGVFGALFILLHRTLVLFLRRNKYVKIVLQQYWLLYPAFISFLMTAITYPLGTGKYLGGEQTFSHTLHDFFIACSWIHDTPYPCPRPVNQSWTGPNGDISIFHSLIAFQITFFILSIIAATLPVPSGIFMPVFVLGGAFGRMIGELLRLFYPAMVTAGFLRVIHPGVYAVVGAAAFCGAVTHTVSVAVIVFELTGQLVLLIPVMIAVLVANAVCSYLQPSIYDSIIKIKRLPYLPDISHSSSMYHSLSAEQFMTTPVAYVGKDSTYGEVQELILGMGHVRAFPLVENRNSMALLGSVTRSQLFKLIQSKVGVKARQAEATERIRRVIDDVSRRYRVMGDGKPANGKVSDLTPPMGTKRFSITPTVEDEAERNRKLSMKYDNNFLTVPGITYGTSFPAVNPDDILAMGTKRGRSSTLSQADAYHTIGEVFRSLARKGKNKKDRDTEFDLHGEDREQWEKYVLEQTIDLTGVQVDPSPFQLVESTSLFKVHSLFSLLGLKRAYVTKSGRLVGVISLNNLRSAIENVQSGMTPTPGESIFPDQKPSESTSENDIDYLHPQLEILTRANTLTDLNEETETQMPTSISDLNRRPSFPPARPVRGLVMSTSDPCLQRRTLDQMLPAIQKHSFLGLVEQSTETVSSNGSSSSESKQEAVRRRPPQVRIVIPDDNESDESMQL